MKKFSEELKALTTPNIRSVLRWLNNQVEKTTKPTELASMKHGKCQTIIEDKYKPADIEKALSALASGDTKKPEKTKPAEKTQTKEYSQKDVAIATWLEAVRDEIDAVIEHVEKQTGQSYILNTSDKTYYVIAAGPKGACVIDGPHPSLEAAHKAWPEAIPPEPIAKAEDVGDML